MELLRHIPREGLSYWANEEKCVVTAYHPTTNHPAWDTYKQGLIEYENRLDFPPSSKDKELEREHVSVVWLIRSADQEVIGGYCWSEPACNLENVARTAALRQLSSDVTSSQFQSISTDLACNGGVVELMGIWAAPGCHPPIELIYISAWHALRWLRVKGVANRSERTLISKISQCGWYQVEQQSHATVGRAEDCGEIVSFCTDDKFRELTERVAARMLREQAYLSMVGSLPLVDYQFIFTDQHRTRLVAEGVKEHNTLHQQLTESSDSGYGEEASLFSARAHPWIYYPWKNAIAKILAPDLFWKVRQDRNRNKLTLTEMDILRQKRVGVIGMSVGGSVAYCMAQEGLCGELRIADFDSLELSNLNRLSGSVLDLGLSKVQMAARRIAEINPYLLVRTFDKGITEKNVDSFLNGLDVVVEECDAFEVKVLVRQRARHFRIPVVMETGDKGLIDVERFDEKEAQPLHGLIPDLPLSKLASMTMEEKIPMALSILGGDKLSARFGASMLEIDSTTSSWPQLAEEISLGVAWVVGACRRILLGHNQPAGRARLGIDDFLDALEMPSAAVTPAISTEAQPELQRPKLPSDPLAAIQMAAHLAPSGGNSQPWRFEVNSEYFTVQVREDLRDVGIDIGRRGSAVACGAALANAWCTASQLSQLHNAGGKPEFFSENEKGCFGGRLQLGSQSDDLALLGQYVIHRKTNRRLGPKESLEEDIVRKLKSAATRGGGRLIYMSSSEFEPAVEAWVESDRIRFLHERLHNELFSELRSPERESVNDGIDIRAMELSATGQALIQLLRRRDILECLSEWNVGSRLGDFARRGFRNSAGVVILAVDGKKLSDYVRGGFAMELVWLEATGLGIWMQPMHPLFGFSQSEEDLIDVAGCRYGPVLHEAKKRAFSRIGLGADESFVLALRVHRGPGPSVLSQRLPLPA